MNLKEYFKSISLEDIDRFIIEKQEENLNLEFKTVNHSNYNDQNKEFDKKNIAEVFSGFANSNGGIVIWGIKAKKNTSGQDIATETTPINELTKFLNTLNKLEGQAVVPIITGIEHVKIEIENTDTGFIKSFIPASSSAPHMALYAGKHYYKRSGDSFYQCEHYDIVDMFSRKKSPILKLQTQIRQRRDKPRETVYEVLISIINEGKSMAKFPYLAMNLSQDFKPNEYGLDGNRSCGLQKVKNNMRFRYNYAGGNGIVIYPEAILDIDIIETVVPLNNPPTDLKINYLLGAEDMENIYDELVLDHRKLFAESF
jgi:hypothetical protein